MGVIRADLLAARVDRATARVRAARALPQQGPHRATPHTLRAEQRTAAASRWPRAAAGPPAAPRPVASLNLRPSSRGPAGLSAWQRFRLRWPERVGWAPRQGPLPQRDSCRVPPLPPALPPRTAPPPHWSIVEWAPPAPNATAEAPAETCAADASCGPRSERRPQQRREAPRAESAARVGPAGERATYPSRAAEGVWRRRSSSVAGRRRPKYQPPCLRYASSASAQT